MNYLKTVLLLALLTALFSAIGFALAGPEGALLAFAVAVAMNFYAFWNSDKLALRMHKARAVDRATAPELWDMVAHLAQNAQLPMPGVYVIDTPQPNAFATGRNPENAAVAVTTGLLSGLNRDEIAGVVAHELAHIKNRDTLIMTIAATLGGAISMLAQFGLYFGGGNRERSGAAGAIGLIAAVLLAPLAATLVQMMVSRTREYAADRMGAQISRDPMALASALNKISQLSRQSMMVSAERNPASAHLFIINPLLGGGMDNLFSTHPNVENRIAALQDLAQSGGY
jgi:heat shock protein HtpX